MEVLYAPSFIRQYKNLPRALKAEVKEKIILFQNVRNHASLGVHKLHGILNEQYSFRVNYKIRIVFWYSRKSPKQIMLLAVGDHDIYE